MTIGTAAVTSSVLRIYTNMHWAHTWVIDMTGAMVTRTQDWTAKIDLVKHMSKASEIMMMCCERVGELGYDWDDVDHEALRFHVLDERYSKVRDTGTELDYVVGVGMFAHGVFGTVEYNELHNQSPNLFPDFAAIGAYKLATGATARRHLEEMIERDPSVRESAAAMAAQYAEALENTVNDDVFGSFLRTLIQQKLLPADITERATRRFAEVFDGLLPNG